MSEFETLHQRSPWSFFGLLQSSRFSSVLLLLPSKPEPDRRSQSLFFKMWQEARKQEKKLRGMMVDHKKRAERRREYYEHIVSLTP